MGRKLSRLIQQQAGVPKDERDASGRWTSGLGVGEISYDRIPYQSIQGLAGFQIARGSYSLPRQGVQIPELLKSQVFPWIETLEKGTDTYNKVTHVKVLEVILPVNVSCLKDSEK